MQNNRLIGSTAKIKQKFNSAIVLLLGQSESRTQVCCIRM